MRDSNRYVWDSNRLSEIWILRQEVIRIRNSKIWIVVWPSAFTFAKGFESITRRFESPCLVLHNSRFRDSNRCVGDSNPCFNLSTCSSWRIWITVWVIWIDGSLLHFFLHQGFESLDWRFESINLNNLTEIWIQIASWRIRIASPVWTSSNWDSNRHLRDSNCLFLICLNFSRIEGLLEGFESPC